MSKSNWCKCDGIGGCLGCKIEVAIGEKFGQQGYDYLKLFLNKEIECKHPKIVGYNDSFYCDKCGEELEVDFLMEDEEDDTNGATENVIDITERFKQH